MGTALHYVFRAGVCARTYTRIRRRERKSYTPDRHKNSGNTEKPSSKFSCTKAKNRKKARKRRKRNHQSAIKLVIFTDGMTNNDSENSHRRHIFFQDSRHFLRFPLGKRRFPLWKTYVSRQGNIRLSFRKHRKLKEKRDLSP